MRPKRIDVKLDGRRRKLHESCWRLFLMQVPTEGLPNHLEIDPDADLDWSQLDRFPLRQLTYSGRDPAVVRYVASRDALRDLCWIRHGQEDIDVRDTGLQAFAFEPSPELRRLSLPGSVTRVGVLPPGTTGSLRVDISGGGDGLALSLDGSTEPPGFLTGLEKLRVLTLLDVRRVELARLAGYRDVEELSVMGAPGTIADVSQLSRFRRLRKLLIRECYDLTGFPGPEELPALEILEIDGVRSESAEAIRGRFEGSAMKLSIRGSRTEAWVRANVDNPFRDWDQSYSEAITKRAMSIYRKAAKALDKLGAEGSAADVEAALHGFVDPFNRLDDQHSLDTSAAEDIADAFFELARPLDAVSEATAEAWLATWRSF